MLLARLGSSVAAMEALHCPLLDNSCHRTGSWTETDQVIEMQPGAGYTMCRETARAEQALAMQQKEIAGLRLRYFTCSA